MPSLEDDLKLNNWLSILTFDAVKYVAAGGSVQAEISGDELVLRLTGVDPANMHSKFRRLLAASSNLELTAPEPPARSDE